MVLNLRVTNHILITKVWIKSSVCLQITLIFKSESQWEQVLSVLSVHRFAKLTVQLSLHCTSKKEGCVVKGHTSTRSLFEFTSTALVSQNVLYYTSYNYTCSELRCTCVDVRELIMGHPISWNAGPNGKIHNNGTQSYKDYLRLFWQWLPPIAQSESVLYRLVCIATPKYRRGVPNATAQNLICKTLFIV